MAAALADDLGDVFLAVVEFVHQRAIAFGLFERIEIGALHVFDDGNLQRFGIGRFDDDDGHFVQAGALRRAPAPFAGDDLVGVGRAAHRPRDDRLNDAALAQRGDELVKFGIGKNAPRIARVRPQRAGRQPALAARPLRRQLPRRLRRSARQVRGPVAIATRLPPSPFSPNIVMPLHCRRHPRLFDPPHAPNTSGAYFSSRWMTSVARRR